MIYENLYIYDIDSGDERVLDLPDTPEKLYEIQDGHPYLDADGPPWNVYIGTTIDLTHLPASQDASPF